MLNEQVLSGKWNQVKGQLKEKWGELSDDDVRQFNGGVDQLVGRIQQKTGESREVIEDFLAELAEEGASFAARARDHVEDTAERVADSARDGYDTLREGYADAERAIQARPGQTIAVAFGLGLLSGLGVALLLRNREKESMSSHSRHFAAHFGRQMLDALSSVVPESMKK